MPIRLSRVALLAFGLAPLLASANPIVISRTANGAGGAAASREPRLSADGRWVVFTSQAQDLAVRDPDGAADVFVANTAAETLRRVSERPDDGVGADSVCGSGAINADGRYIVFSCSDVSRLLPSLGKAAGLGEVVLLDRDPDANGVFDEAGSRSLRSLSVDASGAHDPAADSRSLDISDDGRFVLFESTGSFGSADPGATRDLYLHDRDADADGQFDEPGAIATHWVSERPAQTDDLTDGRLAGDGSMVVFSTASAIDPADTNGVSDVYAHETATRQAIRLSLGPDGRQLAGASFGAVASRTGRHVAFATLDATLAYSDRNNVADAYHLDRDSATLTLISRTRFGSVADRSSEPLAINATGDKVLFRSRALGLTGVDGGATFDHQIHLFDVLASASRTVTVSPLGLILGGTADAGDLDASAARIVVTSTSPNFALADRSHIEDVFLVDTRVDLEVLISQPDTAYESDEDIPYRVEIRNRAPMAATGVELDVVASPQGGWRSASFPSVQAPEPRCYSHQVDAIRCRLGTIDSRNPVVGTLYYRGRLGGTLHLDLQAAADQDDYANQNDSTSIATTILHGPDVRVSGVARASVKRGSEFLAATLVVNDGPVAAENVVVTIPKPVNAKFKRYSLATPFLGADCGKAKSLPMTCRIARLEPGQRVDVNVYLKAGKPGPARYTISATAAGDFDVSNNSNSLQVEVTKK